MTARQHQHSDPGLSVLFTRDALVKPGPLSLRGEVSRERTHKPRKRTSMAVGRWVSIRRTTLETGGNRISGLVRRLLEQKTFEAGIHTVLDDVIALYGAEYRNVQLCAGDEPVLVAQRRLSTGLLNTFRHV